MKKLLFILFLIFAFAQWGEAGTYYIDNSCANNGTGATTVCAGAGGTGPLNSLANYYSKAGGYAGDDQILLKRGLTFAEKLRPPSSGTSGHRIIHGAYGTGNPPIITGDASFAVDTNIKSYLQFQYLMLNGKDFEFNVGTDIVANYVIVKNSDGYGFLNWKSAGVVLNNCVSVGNAKSGLYTSGSAGVSADTIVNNCIITGNGLGSGSFAGVYTASTLSTCTLNYSLVTGNIAQTLSNVKNINTYTTVGVGNIITKAPDVKSGINNNVYAVFGSDGPDDLDLSYWKSISAQLAPYGGKATFFVGGSAITTSDQKADMVILAASGHEFASYSYSWSDYASTKGITISSTNTNPTVNVDLANKTTTLSCDEVANRVTVTWTSDISWNAGSKKISDLTSAAVGRGWTILRETENGDQLKDKVNLASFVDTGGAQACPYTVMLDISPPDYKYWVHELDENASYMNSIVGTPSTTLGMPHGFYTADFLTWLSSRYVAARAGTVSNVALNSINVYVIVGASYTYFTGTEAQIRSNVNHFYELFRQIGGILLIHSHTEAELTSAKLGIVADELFKHGVTFRTFKDVMTEIKADHATADNITYTKTYSDVSDFHLQSGSPAINAGVDVGLTSDIEGNPVPAKHRAVRQPDIGAYEYQYRFTPD